MQMGIDRRQVGGGVTVKHDGEARARMVTTAADLFARRGYHATGLNQILEESGTPKGSLYHYFPAGKEELAAAALSVAGREILATMDTVFEGSESVTAAMETLTRVFEGRMRDSGYQLGCPVATTALEEAATNDRLRAVSREIYHAWSARFARALVAAGWPEERAAALGVLLLACVQGAFLLSRVERDLAPMETVARELELLVSRSQAGRESAPAEGDG